MQTKSEIRRYITDIKKNMKVSQIDILSDIITNKLISSKEYIDNDNILIYVSYNQEVKTDRIISHSLECGKKVYVPKVLKTTSDKHMEFVRIHSVGELAPGYMGIYEPVSNEYTVLKQGLVVMPGIAFDDKKNRIGYGGGFYDRYLKNNMSCFFKTAICFDYQIVEYIPNEPFDIKPDKIITEKRIIS